MSIIGRIARVLACSLIVVPLLVSQQDTGAIDPSGLAISNAHVSVTNQETNNRMSVRTGEDGIFVATPLRIGVYSVTVEIKGFKKAIQEGIRLQVQDRLRVDFQLQVGAVTETLEVNAQAALLQSETTSFWPARGGRFKIDHTFSARDSMFLSRPSDVLKTGFDHRRTECWGNITLVEPRGNFGSITDVVNDNRDIQLGLKFIW
jgi:Carboxypeptidase regulatory-like domain